MKSKLKEWLAYVTDPTNTMTIIFDLMALMFVGMFIMLAISGGHS